LHQFRDKAIYWSKIVIFSYPPCIWRPAQGVRYSVWCVKPRMVGLPDGEKNFEAMYNSLYSILACDRRTDGHLATALSALCIRVAR